MSKEFEIVYEFEVDATPEQVWDAITSGTGGWLWPMEFDGEKRVGPFGSTLTNFDPPHRLTALTEDVGFPTQSLNQIDETIEPRDDGRRAWVRYVHSGIFTDDWDNQYDGARKHNAFYLHTLREYVVHFAGRPVAFATLNGPDASTAADRAAFIQELTAGVSALIRKYDADEAEEGRDHRIVVAVHPTVKKPSTPELDQQSQ